jgi:hypothetical protein
MGFAKPFRGHCNLFAWTWQICSLPGTLLIVPLSLEHFGKVLLLRFCLQKTLLFWGKTATMNVSVN